MKQLKLSNIKRVNAILGILNILLGGYLIYKGDHITLGVCIIVVGLVVILSSQKLDRNKS